MQIELAKSLPLKQAQKPQTPTKLHKTELWPRGSTWQLNAVKYNATHIAVGILASLVEIISFSFRTKEGHMLYQKY